MNAARLALVFSQILLVLLSLGALGAADSGPWRLVSTQSTDDKIPPLTMIETDRGSRLLAISRWQVSVLGLPDLQPVATLPTCEWGAWTSRSSLVTMSEDKRTARLWDLGTGKPIRTCAHPAPISAAHFSPDGSMLLLSGNDHTLAAWSLPEGKPLWTVKASFEGFTRDAGRIIVIPPGAGAGMQVLDARSAAVMFDLDALGGTVVFNTLTPDGRRILAPDLTGMLHLWELADGRFLQQLQLTSMARTHTGFSFLSNDRVAIKGIADDGGYGLDIIDLDPMHQVARVASPAPEKVIPGSILLADGGRIMIVRWHLGNNGSPKDEAVIAYDTATWKPRTTIAPGRGISRIWLAHYPDDGERLLIAYADGEVAEHGIDAATWTFPVRSRTPVISTTESHFAELSADAQWLVLRPHSGRSVHVWRRGAPTH